jgi:3-dehydroquinate synthase
MDGPRCEVSEIRIHSIFGDYSVEVAIGSIANIGEATVALVDPVVRDSVDFASSQVVEVIGSEESKTLAECETVLVAMKRAGLKRGDLVAAVGGGVVQDVATLTSSLYMRGVDWMYAPTTLMAMADSCIGGKSSINAGGIKNLVGNFHPPARIFVDPSFVTTLPQRALASGLAEAVKICFARGRESFTHYLQFEAATAPGADDDTVGLLSHVLEAKKWFVEIDELDKAERQLLNFGHSFGHAWESSCGFRVQHGIGVAVGMLSAIRHPSAVRNELTELLDGYARGLLASVKADVSIALGATDWDAFRIALGNDKKNSRDVLRLVLPVGHESVEVVELPMDDAQLTIAMRSISTVLDEVVA